MRDGNHGGTHPKGKDFIDSGIPFVMASDITRGQVDLIDFQSMPDGDFNFLMNYQDHGVKLLLSKAIIRKTAICVAWGGQTRNSAIVSACAHENVLETTLIMLMKFLNNVKSTIQELQKNDAAANANRNTSI